MSCGCGFGRGNSCCWIIIILIVLWCCCGSGLGGSENECNNNCGSCC